MTDFMTGDTVSHNIDGLNTEIVRGVVSGISRSRSEIEVEWVDGSGPSWHPAEHMILLERRPADGLTAAYENYHAHQRQLEALTGKMLVEAGLMAEAAARVIQLGGEI